MAAVVGDGGQGCSTGEVGALLPLREEGGAKRRMEKKATLVGCPAGGKGTSWRAEVDRSYTAALAVALPD